MVVETDGYLALIEHLAFNLDVFSSDDGDTGAESVEDVVTDMVASNIMAILSRTQNCTLVFASNCLRKQIQL